MTTTTARTRSAATPGTTGVDWSFLGDETFWLTVASIVAAVLTSVGLGHLAVTVRTAIDAAAGSVALVYVGGKAHQRAKVITAAAGAAEAAVNAIAPPDVAAIADQAAQSVIAHFSQGLTAQTAQTAPSAATTAPSAAGGAPAASAG